MTKRGLSLAIGMAALLGMGAAPCHGTDAKTAYATDFHIARNDPWFKGSLPTEFLWSIADVDSQRSTILKERFLGIVKKQ
jgi:hypothetical protein